MQNTTLNFGFITGNKKVTTYAWKLILNGYKTAEESNVLVQCDVDFYQPCKLTLIIFGPFFRQIGNLLLSDGVSAPAEVNSCNFILKQNLIGCQIP